MRIRNTLTSLLGTLVLALAATGAHAQAREEGRLLMASQVLEELGASKDQAIPNRLLERAYGIAVIPDVIKAAFFVGGQRGKGVLVVRDKDGRFTSPAFISITGGSFGWQFGGQATDIVLVFTTRRGVDGISGGKVTLGANLSVAAGPVGRAATASTDAGFSAEIYSYSRTRGLFAGVALDGSAITIDDDSNAAFYKRKDVLASDILSGAVRTDDEAAQRFMRAIRTSTGSEETAAPAPAPAAPSQPAQAFPLTSEPPPASPPPQR